jgi:hypothetical protein
VNGASPRSTIRFLIGTVIGVGVAAWNSVRWMHSTSPDAPVWAKLWLVLCALSVILGLLRFAYYRNRRNYFAEEMDRRRSLARDQSKS